VASRTSARYRTGTLLAIVKTTGNGTISRSCESSLPAPSILHGFLRTMRSWSAAVVKMACSSR